MVKRFDGKPEGAGQTAANDPFKLVPPSGMHEPSVGASNAHVGLQARERVMAEFSIQSDGAHYVCSGKRFERLADAIGHARMLQPQGDATQRQSQGHAPPHTKAPEPAR